VLKAECISGVDAIVHVASPLSDAASPQKTVDVRGGHNWLKFSSL